MKTEAGAEVDARAGALRAPVPPPGGPGVRWGFNRVRYLTAQQEVHGEPQEAAGDGDRADRVVGRAAPPGGMSWVR